MKINMLLAVIILSSFAMKAQQPFSPPGAVWYYNFTVPLTPYIGYSKISYMGDSTVMGQVCKKLEEVDYNFYAPDSFLSTTTHVPYLIYQHGDTVFWLSDGVFVVLFNFGAQTGDQWVVDIHPSIVNCDSLSVLKVSGTSADTINGQVLRVFYADTVSQSPFGFHGKIMERIGAVDQNFFMPGYQNCDSTIIYEHTQYEFQCYEDSAFALYNTGSNPCGMVDGIREKASHSLAVSPNPSEGKFGINTQGKSVIFVYNVAGKCIFQKQADEGNTVIDLDVPSGLYIIKIKTADIVFRQKLIIQ